jgi:uncharacterized protein (DUF2252 family)
MHLENFGAFRPNHRAPAKGEESPRHAVFDVNDFDDAVLGPFHFDVLRLTTSLILGGRELGADGVTALELCHLLLDAYVAALSGDRVSHSLPAPIRQLVTQVSERPQTTLLGERTTGQGGRRKFRLGLKYRALPARVAKKVPAAFAAYVKTVNADERGAATDHFEILDVARRIAGTGSLGCLRIAVLTRGKGGKDGQWIFDLKEEGVPSAAVLLGKPDLVPAARVATAARACLARPPRMIGVTQLGKVSMYGRRLAPQEDKLDLARVRHEDLAPLATTLGALLGRAHRHGATKLPKKPWSEGTRARLVDHAITLAGLHEAVYLAICKSVRRAS